MHWECAEVTKCFLRSCVNMYKLPGIRRCSCVQHGRLTNRSACKFQTQSWGDCSYLWKWRVAQPLKVSDWHFSDRCRLVPQQGQAHVIECQKYTAAFSKCEKNCEAIFSVLVLSARWHMAGIYQLMPFKMESLIRKINKHFCAAGWLYFKTIFLKVIIGIQRCTIYSVSLIDTVESIIEHVFPLAADTVTYPLQWN